MHTDPENQTVRAAILIIEDDISQGALVDEQLQLSGYQTRLCHCARDGLAIAADGDFDMAIVDNGLPDMQGAELAERLRQQELPFIMLTGSSTPSLVASTSRSGALAYLVKPVSRAQLVSAVEAALLRAEEIAALRDAARTTRASSESREISIAIGILMDHHKLSEKIALEYLRKQARNRRCKMTDLAHELVEASSHLNRLLTQFGDSLPARRKNS